MSLKSGRLQSPPHLWLLTTIAMQYNWHSSCSYLTSSNHSLSVTTLCNWKAVSLHSQVTLFRTTSTQLHCLCSRVGESGTRSLVPRPWYTHIWEQDKAQTYIHGISDLSVWLIKSLPLPPPLPLPNLDNIFWKIIFSTVVHEGACVHVLWCCIHYYISININLSISAVMASLIKYTKFWLSLDAITLT